MIDIRDLAFPTVAAVFTSSTLAIEHNGYVLSETALYVSHYERGVTILDITCHRAARDGVLDTYTRERHREVPRRVGRLSVPPERDDPREQHRRRRRPVPAPEEVQAAVPPATRVRPSSPSPPRGRVAPPCARFPVDAETTFP